MILKKQIASNCNSPTNGLVMYYRIFFDEKNHCKLLIYSGFLYFNNRINTISINELLSQLLKHRLRDQGTVQPGYSGGIRLLNASQETKVVQFGILNDEHSHHPILN